MKGIEGSTLGRYELRRRIAQGGTSAVYLAYDRRVRRRVAVKVLYGGDESFVRRFEREALAVGALSHNHILPLYDFGEQYPWYYLVMPYIEGSNLRDYLLQRGCLTLEEAGRFLDQIASALQHAHDHGVVHRDVKPSNILLRPDGYAYLVDFGLAKAKMEAESLTHVGVMVGTPEYMAPEQSNGVNDHRSDIYSLGIILYQMLTGRVPFVGESPVAVTIKHMQAAPTPPSKYNSDIPPSIEEVILKALAKNPDERYQQARDFALAYKKALLRELVRSQAEQPSLDGGIEAGGPAARMPPAPAITRIIPLSEDGLTSPQNTQKSFPLSAEISSSPFLPHSQGKKRSVILLVATLLCMILLSSGLLLELINTARQQGPYAAGSQISDRQWTTMTAQARTGAQATLAAQARVQATAGITSSIGTGKVLYTDDLTSPGSGWIDDGSQCFFSPDGYHVNTARAHMVAWCYSDRQSFSDAVITAQARLLRGDIYGLVFRLSPGSKAFYALEINAAGEYRFIRAQGSNPLNWLTLIDWTESSAIASGYGHTNTFLIVATGANFRFYINKQLIVATFSDSAYAAGLVGFLAGGDSGGGAEAVFSNLWVFQK
jgi:serine/threonine protein kinase